MVAATLMDPGCPALENGKENRTVTSSINGTEGGERTYLPSSLDFFALSSQSLPFGGVTLSYSGMHNLAISIEPQNVKSASCDGMFHPRWEVERGRNWSCSRSAWLCTDKGLRLGIPRASDWLAPDAGLRRSPELHFNMALLELGQRGGGWQHRWNLRKCIRSVSHNIAWIFKNNK